MHRRAAARQQLEKVLKASIASPELSSRRRGARNRARRHNG
jgi:hypothetical protein